MVHMLCLEPLARTPDSHCQWGNESTERRALWFSSDNKYSLAEERSSMSLEKLKTGRKANCKRLKILKKLPVSHTQRTTGITLLTW